MPDPKENTPEGIAIVGMSGRFPGAKNIEQFWENLKSGVESISFFTNDELTASGIDVEALHNTPNYVPARGVLEGAEMFDAQFFGINPKEAEVIDPQQRVFLETAWHALENAGYDPGGYPGSIGVYAGMSNNTYFLSNVYSHPDLIEMVGALQTMMGNEKDYLATRVSYKLNLKGPSLSIYTACSTSLVAVCVACQSLQNFECDMALAGGISITLPQKRGYFYQDGGIGSADGHCRAFDENAQGTVFSNGVGIVVLKRLADALADGDSILAVIKGAALNNDGSGKVSYTAPSVDGQAEVIVMAQALAGVDADSITYVEAHGTATPLGDPIEIAALTQAFRASTKSQTFCGIGSLKTNVGHLDAAAGVAGLIKTVLSLQHKLIPPSLHFKNPNPKIDFANSPFFVNTQLREWNTDKLPRRAGISSFGVGGTNSHVVLEEAPPVASSGPTRPHQLILLSARTNTALETATDNLLDHLKKEPDADLANIAYTLKVGRRGFPHRRVLVCKTANEAIQYLEARDPKRVFTETRDLSDPSVVFLFPGQGVQHVNMGAGLYASQQQFRKEVDGCCEILKPLLGLDLRKILYPPESEAEASQDKLTQTWITQPALFVIEYALAKLWMNWGLMPDAMIGHSVGEYVAACLAGVFTLEDALRVLATRARMMQELPAGAMLAVRLPEKEVRPLLGEKLAMAAINGKALCVVSGPTDAVEELHNNLVQKEIACRRLHTSHAFHSSMMDPILEGFTRVVAQTKLNPPQKRYISNLSATWITAEEATDPAYWARHLRHAVRFAEGAGELLKESNRLFLEIGPGQTLATLVRQHPNRGPKHVVLSSLNQGTSTTQDSDDQESLLTALGRVWMSGLHPDWKIFYSNERRNRIPLPGYPFERKRYFVEPCRPGPFEMLPMPEIGANEMENIMITSAYSGKSSHPEDEEGENMVEVPSGQPQATNRRDTLVATLRAMFQEMSGMNLEGADPALTFLEMGFDSLFLTQASQALKKKFGVKVTFRQMLEEVSNLNDLASYLDQKMPPEPLSERSAPQRKQEPVRQPAVKQDLSAGSAESQPAGLAERIMKQQLQIMAEQLEVLRNLEQTSQSDVPSTSLATEKKKGEPSGIPPTKAETKFHGPFRPIEKGSTGDLTRGQQEYLTDFISRYSKKTAESKRITQLHRKHLADPRAVAGFRQIWKEIVYPIVATRSAGSRIWDVDGNEYVDLTLGFGINLFGHSPAFVTEAIQRQLMLGVEIGPQTALAGEVAQMMREFTGMERITFCNTGSEAVMAAMRVARTVTGRNKIVLFAGAYHGMFDEVLVRPGAVQGQLRTSSIAPGIPEESLQNIIVLEYGAPESLEIIRSHAEDIAAVLVEPVQSRRPDLQPVEFLRELRKLTTEKEIALVFDEVVTGFRVHPGGAQALFGIKADMATYGKVLGGGLPIGILTGNSSYMDALDGGVWEYGDTSFPEVGVTFFAGTFVRHPLALAAARAVLNHLKQSGPALQQELNDKTTIFVAELNRILEELGLPYNVPHFSSFFYLNFPSDLKYAGLFFHHLREKGVHLWEGRCGFLSTAHSDEDIQVVLDAFRQSAAEMQAAGFLPVPKPTGDDNSGPQAKKRIPLSDAQKEVWLASQMGEDASCSFNESLAIRLKGALNVDALRRSLQEIVRRHEALRTTFSSDGDYQMVSTEDKLEVPLLDLSSHSDEKRQTELTQILMGETGEAFDLVSGPLLRAKLIRLHSDHHILALTAHHIVCDGWSFGVILLELSKTYSADVRGNDPNLEPQMQFSEYVAWQNQQQEEQNDAEDFWLRQFKEPATTVDLPTDRPRPSLKTYHGAQERIVIDQDLQSQLKRISSQYSSTFFSTLLSAFLTLLYRFTGQEDLVVGVPAAGQAIADRKSLIGHCVNLLPLRLHVKSETKFCDFLKFVKRALLEAYEHQNFTFGTLVQKLNLPRDPSRIPLLTTTFNVDRVAVGLEFEGLNFEVETNPKISVNFETKFNLVEREDKLLIECDYNLDLFDPETIRRWLGHFEILLRGIVSNPEQPVAKLPLMTEEELNQVLIQWNRTEAAYPLDCSIQEVFEEQAKQFAKTTAVAFGTQEMSYAEINSKANQLAHYLRKLGVQPETRVGICADRSIELIVGLLAILKAGGCYVPLDPDHPNERLSYQLIDTGSTIVLVQERYAARFSKQQAVRIDSPKEFASQPVTNPSRLNSADHLAYVMYTSGSTGKPKGVMVPHRAVLRLVKGVKYADLNSEQSFLQFAPVTFDASTFEIWGSLLNGARLVMAPPENLSLSELAQFIERNRITTLWLTAGLFHQMAETQPEVLRRVDQLLAGGDVLSPTAVKKILAMKKTGKLINGYGPTENTTFTCCYPMTSPDQVPDTVPIGRPISNTKVYILDRNMQPVPIGIPGELHIGGAGLARGYLNAAELNKEKFVPNSFEDGSGSKLYKSGDLVRYLPDGNIEFFGRIDNQVKIRGFRVEPGEVESVLSTYPSIKECSVIVREDTPQDKRLVAYIVGSERDQSPKELKAFLRDRLPDYMVPSAIVFLDQLPLTPNGKVDRNALPSPQDLRPEMEQAFIGPRNETEEAVAEIWTKVLRLNQVGIHDNFFELGGHSLLATQVLSRLRDVFQVDLPLRSFFEVPTIAALADQVMTAKENGGRLQRSAILNVARDTHRVKRSSI